MGAFGAIAQSGVASVLRHPLRSAVTAACVVSVVLPYVAGAAVSRGLLDQAEDSARLGPDFTIRGQRFGRAVPLPISAVEDVRARLKEVPGADVTPRIVGEIALGRDRVPAVLVGVERERLPPSAECVEGSWFRDGPGLELVVGRTLARRLGLRPGSTIPPFYENERGQRVATVAGVFRADAPVWESSLVLASLASASWVFAQEGLCTEIDVRCPPAYREDARRSILAIRDVREPEGGHGPGGGAAERHGPLRLAVVAREDALSTIGEGVLHRQGVFGIYFLLALAVGIPLVLVTSGIGLSERRREVGLLKALGWQTDEVLLRAASESLVLAVGAACLAILLAWAWLGPLGGPLVASLFLDTASAGVAPGPAAFDVPFRLTPVPALLAIVASLAVVLVGTLVSTWRTASAAPAEALR